VYNERKDKMKEQEKPLWEVISRVAPQLRRLADLIDGAAIIGSVNTINDVRDILGDLEHALKRHNENVIFIRSLDNIDN
jgi:hypothetical protein